MPSFGTAQPHSLPQLRKSLKPRGLGACSRSCLRTLLGVRGRAPRVTLGLRWEIFLSEPKPRPSLSTYSKSWKLPGFVQGTRFITCDPRKTPLNSIVTSIS